MTEFKCGYCGIVGRPNAGKSTLMNRLCGEQVAIVTDKPQTTRDMITGIKTTKEAQIIFLDTPGLHESQKALNVKMIKAAEEAAKEADLLLVLCDPTQERPDADARIAEKMVASGKPVIAAVNKIDCVAKETILPLMKMFADAGITDIYPISAATGEGVEELEKGILAKLPAGPQLFPEDQITDQNERFLASEMIREKIFLFTHLEVPYASMVSVEEYKERSEKLTAVRATIFVEKESQKGILIGQGGAMIKRIGQAARESLEQRFGRKFYLELSVKTRKDWTRDEGFLKKMDSAYKG
ncbi:MAG: GTPase Era [Nitrospinae bacterium]|nr:GTPase Era [Nitrospinota bacterium]